MSLYPTLEDMKVDQIQKAQQSAFNEAQATSATLSRRISEEHHGPSLGGLQMGPPLPEINPDIASCYPSLAEDYMGLRLEPPSGPIAQAQPQPAAGYTSPGYPQSAVVPAPPQHVALPAGGAAGATSGMIAPLTQGDKGLARAHVTHGVREVILCKDAKGKVGLRFRAIDKGVFVQFVAKDSAAALGGLRFGDQILQIDGQNVAGYKDDKVFNIIKKAKDNRIVFAVRDRPFERTITLHKDSNGSVGFTYRGNKITNIVKDSSAARNGLLIDHYFLEVNGINVIEMKDKELSEVIDSAGKIVTLTIMPGYVYEHMVKTMSSGLMKKLMDHSVPEV